MRGKRGHDSIPPTEGLLRSVRERLRLRDLNALSSEARSQERNKRIGLAAFASMGARGVGLLTLLISIPLTVRYLGAEQYGLWVTISSLTGLLGFANFGLTNGLVSAVSEAEGRNDRESVQRDTSSAFYLLLAASAVLGLLFAVTYGSVEWADVFNVSSPQSAHVAGPAMAVFIALTLIGLPLGVVQSTQAGFQEAYAPAAWQSAGSLFSLVGLVVAIGLEAELPWLVVMLAGGPVIAALLNGIAVLRTRPWLVPRIRKVTLASVRNMFRLGVLFFVLALAAAVAFQTDNIVIAQLLGASEVAQYAVPMRLFMIAPLILSFALTPLWPAYTEAVTRGDHAWVKRTLTISLMASAGVGIAISAILFAFGRPLVQAWAGDAIDPSLSLLLALATWAVVNCLTGPIAMYLNGIRALGFQATCAVVMMVANVALSVGLTQRIGISGPAWGSVIAQVVFVLVPCIFYTRSKVARMSPNLATRE